MDSRLALVPEAATGSEPRSGTVAVRHSGLPRGAPDHRAAANEPRAGVTPVAETVRAMR